MSLPINRSSKFTLDTNLSNGNTSDAPAIKNSNDVVYNTIDELNAKVDSLVTSGTLSPVPPDFMQRQAIINSNFEVAQRGTSFTNPVSGQYTLDRWQVISGGTGTNPTVTHSQQNLTAGDIVGSDKFYRVSPAGAGAGYLADVYYLLAQKIENGTKKLCGVGKKVTVSFYAKSSIAGKRIGVSLRQDYGSGGVPSAVEDLIGIPVTLTSTWTKYTVTFATNTLVGKTFGTNNDDNLRLSFWPVWGTNYNGYFNTGAAEVFAAAGDIDIAQVQVNAGDIAYPFQPQTYGEEEIKALRFNRRIVATGVNGIFGSGQAISTTQAYIFVPFGVRMRLASPTLSSLGNFGLYISSLTAILAVTGISLSTAWANKDGIMLIVTVASGLTASTPVILIANNDVTAYLNFDAEF